MNQNWSLAQSWAMGAVQLAIKRGELRQLDDSLRCVDCGKVATDYDHRDYREPLRVEPVCRSCNKLRGPATGCPRMPRPTTQRTTIAHVRFAKSEWRAIRASARRAKKKPSQWVREQLAAATKK